MTTSTYSPHGSGGFTITFTSPETGTENNLVYYSIGNKNISGLHYAKVYMVVNNTEHQISSSQLGIIDPIEMNRVLDVGTTELICRGRDADENDYEMRHPINIIRQEGNKVYANLTFYVKDYETKQPINEVTIDIEEIQGITDSAGWIVFPLIEANKTYNYTATKTGYTPLTGSISLTPSTDPQTIYLIKGAEPEPEPEPGALTIQGYVKDADEGTGIAAATVKWLAKSATTDLAGFYSIDNAETGSGTITATASGYATSEQIITTEPEGTMTVDFNMSKGLGTASTITELPRLKYDALDQYNTSFAGFLKFLEPGSPAERGEAAELISNFSDYAMKGIKNPLDQFKSTHSPVLPDEVPATVTTIAGAAIGAMGVAAAGATLAEMASLGQIESVTWWLQWILDKLNVDGYAGTPFEVEYDTGLKIPFQYHVNSKYQPLIPGMQDLIRFCLREAYPDTREGWINNLPTDQKAEEQKEMDTMLNNFYIKFDHWAKYQGYSDYWTAAYWHAHWILPSVSQLFEMKHRDIIDEETLTRMLTINDIHPAWIDRIKQITYEPARLTDIRTAYEYDVIDLPRFKTELLKRGYDPADVDWVIESSVKMLQKSEIGRITTQWINNVVEGFLDSESLAAKLRTLGIRQEIIDINILESIVKRDLNMNKELADAWLDRFQKGWIGESECRTELSNLGMTSKLVDHNIQLRSLKIKPTEEGE